ncbi:zinc ABC transporter substrate-binding protein [Halomicrobium sp. IBSBa]|uniref:metal ABC transporter substrate-binding protein n=1 Tax=Halomicrobium sp. IBSBa TaxID=2778916 RepID=UPI001ABFD8FB|nr:metal ABC transporter substrate-binding protein [Halomicrobium sp. IBSBa]MBO4247828.1 zinc ABC transporter substrate-binding protein [Halomicrobium sp. IBSBa]
MTRHTTRRQWLGVLAGATAAGTAGCLDSTAGGTDETLSVAASFFVLGDLASNVAGDRASVETLVPVGQHGHGWQPGPDVTRRAVEADVFVYMAPGFQPWADDVVTNIESGDSDTAIIEARTGVDLLTVPEEGGHNHGSTDEQGENHTEHSGHSDDHADHDTAHDDGHHADHDERPVDPHFWLDPRRARTAVETIESELQAADEGNAGAYADNAERYRERLSELDETFETALSDRERETVLVAGHNAFQYLGRRYGFEVVALTGLSPDDSPTSDDLRRVERVISDHDLDHVLAPVMESEQAAAGIVSDTSARERLPITALPGRHSEWADRGWGYEQIMSEVNLPTLETALGSR